MTTSTNDRFIIYPAGYVFAVLDEPGEAESTLADLRAQGLDEGLLCFTGEEGARRIDASGREHGVFARVVRFLELMDNSRVHAEQYSEEARAGHFIVGVHSGNDGKDRARELLAAHGGRFINYYGERGLTESLVP